MTQRMLWRPFAMYLIGVSLFFDVLIKPPSTAHTIFCSSSTQNVACADHTRVNRELLAKETYLKRPTREQKRPTREQKRPT
jgi:hypothetical protein